MAVNKSKRSIHLAQQQLQHAGSKAKRTRLSPRSTELQPVRAHVYRTIAEMNGGFEQAMEALQTLEKIKHLPAATLNWIGNQTGLIRAEANRDLMAALSRRELANTSHFHHLSLVPPAKP